MATNQEIKDAGLNFISDTYYHKNPYTLPTTETAPTQNFGIPYTNAFTGGGGGGGDGGGGFGTWGNLDKDSGKWFQVEGHDDPIEGFKNINTGLYQDEAGLNIQNLGIGSFGLMGMLENAMGWDKKEPKYPGFFQQHNIRDIGKMRKFFEKQDIEKWRASEEKRAQDIIDSNKAAAQKAAADTQAAKTGPARSHTGEAIAAGDLRDIGGGFHEYQDAGASSKYEGSFKDGGRIGFKDGAQFEAANQGMDISPGTTAGGEFRGGDNTPNINTDTVPTNKTDIVYDNTRFGKVPTGLTKDLNIGRLSAIMNLKKTLEEEDLEGKLQYDSSLGPFATTALYDTTTGPEFNAAYSNNNLNANFNTKTGLVANYTKDFLDGRGNFTTGATYDPITGEWGGEAKIGINFQNGGLARLL